MNEETSEWLKERARRIPADLPWNEYPIGTKAHDFMGGHWLRIAQGWKWQPNGGTFPTPGASAYTVTLPDQEGGSQ